ncbi:MAG: T9SS type A sorting domain-containing protein, partial [Chitinophagaceae bacterium]|nr:T9SS type A sorting domain-containing protein [Chitinophagaceae bacterium]
AASWGGTTVATNNITFANLSPNTTYQIRIRTVCTPGTTFSANSLFSDTVVVSTNALPNLFESGFTEMPVRVYPNPTSNLLQIDYTSATSAPVQIILRDMTGRILYETEMNSLIGENNNEIDMSSLSNGLYWLTLNQEGKRIYAQKVQKMN